MNRWRAIGGRCERAMASPWGFWSFAALTVALLIVGVNAANLFISIATAALVLLQLAAARAGMLAIQAKLDELLHAIAGAREDLVRAEENDEATIAGLRL